MAPDSCPWCGSDPSAQAADRDRIDELAREVRLLRETVARLRGGPAPGARSSALAAPARQPSGPRSLGAF